MKNVKKVKGVDPWAEPPHLKIVESIHLPPRAPQGWGE